MTPWRISWSPHLANLLPALLLGGCVGDITGMAGESWPRTPDSSHGPVEGATPTAQPVPLSGATPPGMPPVALPPARSCAPPPARLWKLSATEYARTVEAIFAGYPDPTSDFARTLPAGDRPFANEADHLDMPLGHVTPPGVSGVPRAVSRSIPRGV